MIVLQQSARTRATLPRSRVPPSMPGSGPAEGRVSQQKARTCSRSSVRRQATPGAAQNVLLQFAATRVDNMLLDHLLHHADSLNGGNGDQPIVRLDDEPANECDQRILLLQAA